MCQDTLCNSATSSSMLIPLEMPIMFPSLPLWLYLPTRICTRILVRFVHTCPIPTEIPPFAHAKLLRGTSSSCTLLPRRFHMAPQPNGPFAPESWHNRLHFGLSSSNPASLQHATDLVCVHHVQKSSYMPHVQFLFRLVSSSKQGLVACKRSIPVCGFSIALASLEPHN